MKKSLKIILIIIGIIIALIIFKFVLEFFIEPLIDTSRFNKAIETGDVSYCMKIQAHHVTPGPKGTCISLVSQKNNDPVICENSDELQIGDCYALYAYYKNDESLCIEPQCSKALYNYCIEMGCGTIKDYE